ncbi:CHRD domain-containing protein [Ramlibacter monticola]|uniref:CHRD domain-containing protein n=2 Tax=Ramlibacter monticola TaxID=1926872 RepID=A0A936YS82_9BURK|nr:CHRD domain-containing protein [Ramlibacter monticola]
MMISRAVFLGSTAAVLLAFGLAGCDTMKSMTGGGGSTDRYEASLSPSQEVPPNTSTGSGQAEVTVNRDTSTMNYRVSYTGLSGPATAGHIHGPAAPGANAGVAVPFPNVATSPVTGEVKLTPEQLNQLSSGQWYVNIHTARNPGGEIRGQLRKR